MEHQPRKLFARKDGKRSKKKNKGLSKVAKKLIRKDINHHMAVKARSRRALLDVDPPLAQEKNCSDELPVPQPRIRQACGDIETIITENEFLDDGMEEHLHHSEEDELPIDDDGFHRALLDSCSLVDIFHNPEQQRRMYVAAHFVSKYGGLPDSPSQPWYGHGGVIAKIKNDLNLAKKCAIQYVLEGVVECRRKKTKYNSLQKAGSGRKAHLKVDSPEAQIVADELEDGGSQRLAWHAVNAYRESVHKESVSFSVVYTLIKNLKPLPVRVEDKRQGSSDDKSRICRARKAWMTQLAIRQGLIDYREIMIQEGKSANEPIPEWYDKKNLTCFNVEQVTFWDETHKKVRPGNAAAFEQHHVLTFPRDCDGKLDLECGTYQPIKLAKLKCKYTEEVRLCIGVHANKEVGTVLDTFVYTEKTLLSIPDWKKKENEAITHVKALNDENARGWLVADPSSIGKIFLNDCLSKIPKLGPTTLKRFHEAQIQTIQHLKDINDSQRVLILEKRAKGNVSHQKLSTFIQFCSSEAIVETCRPPCIDHRLADNPFQSRYGEEWPKIIKKTKQCRKYRCITELIDHIFYATKAHFAGTEYEDNFFFYHDALSLMTAAPTIAYMKTNHIYRHWIIPEGGLFSKEHDPDLKAYRNRPVGNSPELMPLDNTLNRDIHADVMRACSNTKKLEKSDPRKFLMNTPKNGTNAYLKLLSGQYTPGSKRIIEDVMKFQHACVEILKAKGKVVPGLADNVREGKRKNVLDLSPTKKQQRGGWHARDASKDRRRQNLHPDEIAGREVKVEASVSTHHQLKKREEVVKDQRPKTKNSDIETESQAKKSLTVVGTGTDEHEKNQSQLKNMENRGT